MSIVYGVIGVIAIVAIYVTLSTLKESRLEAKRLARFLAGEYSVCHEMTLAQLSALLDCDVRDISGSYTREEFENRLKERLLQDSQWSNAAIKLVDEAKHAQRENRLHDAHRDLVEAVVLFRRARDHRECSRAHKALRQVERSLGLPRTN